MCSTFLNRKHYHSVYSKSQYETPKQLLQLRSQLEPLISPDLSDSSDSFCSHHSFQSPQPRLGSQKLHLTYIEKSQRGVMNTQQQLHQQHHYQAYDHPHLRKTAPPPTRTPSSGFSSASSSENMFSGLSISSTEQHNEQKIREILDPSVEVDLDMFLAPDARYKQPAMQMPVGKQQMNGFVANYQNKSMMPSPYTTEFSYSNIKRTPGYTDYMPAQSTAPTVPMSPGTWIRCQYCWETYVKLCQRVTNLDPVVTCDGPWHWHSLYDAQGRVTCPRLWFTQLDRAGSDMLEQMVNVRNAPV